MTTIAQAKRLWNSQKSKFAVVKHTRTAVLGDGKGLAASNISVPNSSDHVWARDTAEATIFYPLLNRTGVPLVHDMPVLVGYTDEEPNTEQVLRIFTEGLGPTLVTTVPTAAAHKQQHEFGGGDVPDIEGRLFTPGRISPTSPPGMTVNIGRFVYYYDEWRKYDGGESDSLSQFVPASGYEVYVLIAFDPESRSIVYRPGMPYATGSLQDIFPTFESVPAPGGNEYPLGWIFLESTTTSVSWTTSSDNIGDARLHIGFPARNILERLSQLEGLSGNDPNIALTGAALNSTSGYVHTLDNLLNVAVGGAANGQALIYEQSTNRWVPGTAVGSGGATLYALGASDVSGASSVGISASAAPGDHVHRGVQSVNVPGNVTLFGQVYVESGTGTTVTQSGGSIIISASGVGSISGSGVADRLAFWSGTSVLSNSSGITYNAPGNYLLTGGIGLGNQTGLIDPGTIALNNSGASTANIWAGDYDGGTYSDLVINARSHEFIVNGNTALFIKSTSGIVVENFVDMSAMTAPGEPGAGYGRLYVRSDGMLCYKNAAGSETVLAP